MCEGVKLKYFKIFIYVLRFNRVLKMKTNKMLMKPFKFSTFSFQRATDRLNGTPFIKISLAVYQKNSSATYIKHEFMSLTFTGKYERNIHLQ